MWEWLIKSCEKQCMQCWGTLRLRRMFSQPQCVLLSKHWIQRPLTPVSAVKNNLGAITSIHFLNGNRNVYLRYLLCAEEFVYHRQFFWKKNIYSNFIWVYSETSIRRLWPVEKNRKASQTETCIKVTSFGWSKIVVSKGSTILGELQKPSHVLTEQFDQQRF